MFGRDPAIIEINQLKKEPTVSKWELELRRVLFGQRDYAIVRLGSVEEYIDAILAESKDRPLAEAAFHEALRHIVQEWQPSERQASAYVSLMLDLITAYTPLNGEVKVLGQIQRWGSFGDEQPAALTDEGHFDLHMKALFSVRNYFPLAPALTDTENASFKVYVDVLRHELNDPRYCGYAAGQLINLKVLSADDHELLDLIRNRPACLNGLLSALFAARSYQLNAHLTKLYGHCLTICEDVRVVFEREVTNLGASIEYEQPNPIIHLRGERISLDLRDTALEQYLFHYWKQPRHVEDLESLLQDPANHPVFTSLLGRYIDDLAKLGGHLLPQFVMELERKNIRLNSQNQRVEVHHPYGTPIQLDLSPAAIDQYLIHVAWGEPETQIKNFTSRFAASNRSR